MIRAQLLALLAISTAHAEWPPAGKQRLPGYSSTTGTLGASDTIEQAISKLNGNVGQKLPLSGGTMTGAINLGGFTLTNGALAGNASTATALAANPTDCGVGQFANAIDASGNLTCATPASGGTPGGSDTQVQYNSSGAFAGSSNFTWDNTNKRLGLGLGALATQGEVEIAYPAGQNGASFPHGILLRDSAAAYLSGTAALQLTHSDDSGRSRINAFNNSGFQITASNSTSATTYGQFTMGSSGTTLANKVTTADALTITQPASVTGKYLSLQDSASHSLLTIKPASSTDPSPRLGIFNGATPTSVTPSYSIEIVGDKFNLNNALVLRTSDGTGLASGTGSMSFNAADTSGLGAWTAYNDSGTNFNMYNGVGSTLYGQVKGTSTGMQIGYGSSAAASKPALTITTPPFTGGTATTTKPTFLIEPASTTSTGWSTSGTALGVNGPTGFAGNLADLQVSGTSKMKVDSTGFITANNMPVMKALNANFTTTAATNTDTNLSFAAAASTKYILEFHGTAQCSSTGGVKYQITAPTGSTVEGWLLSSTSAITTLSYQRITAINTLTGTATHTVATTPGPDAIYAVVTTSSTAGSIAIGAASVTATQTTTIFAGASATMAAAQGI